jgi:N-acetylmuramoyl-L-alanine amidase
VSSSDAIMLLVVMAVATILLRAGQAGAATANGVTFPDDGSDDGDDTDGSYDLPDDGGDMPAPSASNMPTGDLLTFAQTLYGETLPGNAAQCQAVANVIVNRKADVLYFPYGIAGVGAICRFPKQFSCWNSNNTRSLARIQSANMSDQNFALCVSTAQAAMNGTLADVTGGAEFYHDTSITDPWSSYVKTVQIGNLIFYKRGSFL